MPSDFIDYVSGDVINYVTMTDEPEIVLINEKTVTVGDIGMIVRGDVNSQEVEFEINRKYDNVDLLGKDFYIIFKTKGGVFKEPAIDISYNDYKIRFNWLLSENATMYAGNITACVQIEGTDEKGNLYKNKTKNFIIVIQDALSEYDADGVYTSWATEIEDKIEALEEAEEKTTDVFAGTQEEYNQAVINNKFSNGMVITITDE